MATNSSNGAGWLGWVGFASFMMLLGGIFSFIAGLVALFKDTVVYTSETNTTWVLNFDQWGWIHIIVGALAILAAGSLINGKMFGRIVAILIATISAVANMMFVPIYPVWSLLIITIDILVIYAVAVHAGELRDVA